MTFSSPPKEEQVFFKERGPRLPWWAEHDYVTPPTLMTSPISCLSLVTSPRTPSLTVSFFLTCGLPESHYEDFPLGILDGRPLLPHES